MRRETKKVPKVNRTPSGEFFPFLRQLLGKASLANHAWVTGVRCVRVCVTPVCGEDAIEQAVRFFVQKC